MSEGKRQNKRSRNRWLKPLAWVSGSLLLTVLALLMFVSLSTSGLRWAVWIAHAALGEQLTLERVDGRLVGPLQLEGFLFRYPGGEVSFGRLELDWTPRRLFFNHVNIEVLNLEDLRLLRTGPAGEAEPEPEKTPGGFTLDVQLPGDLTITSASLRNLTYQDDTQQQRIDRILLSAYTRNNSVYIDTLQVDRAASTISATGRLALTPRDESELKLAWQLDLPEIQQLTSKGSFTLTGKPDAYRFLTDINVRGTQVPAGNWHLMGNGDLDGLTLESVRGETLDGVVSASGKLQWQAGFGWDVVLALQNINPGEHWSAWPGRLTAQLASDGRYADGKPDLRAHLEKLNGTLREHSFEVNADMVYRENDTRLSLNWALNPDASTMLATRGKLTVDGTPRAYRFAGDAALQGPQIPAGTWQLAGTGRQQGLTLEKLHGEVLGGSVTGSGDIDWQPQVRWDMTLDTRQLDPGLHWPEWPGRLSGKIASAGHLTDGNPELNARLQGLGGELRGYPVNGDAEVAIQGTEITVQGLQLRSGDNHLTASGHIGEAIAMDWRLAANDLSAVLPDWRGVANLDGKLFGSRTEPGMQAKVAVSKLSGPQLELQALGGDILLQQSESAQQSIDLQASELQVQGRRFQHSALKLSGTLLQHRLALRTESGTNYADIAATGAWQKELWRGTLATAQWNTFETGEWMLDKPVALTLGKSRVQLPDSCWSQQQAKLCIDIDADPVREWRASSSLQALPLAFFNKLLDEPLQWDSDINVTLHAAGRAGDVDNARLQAAIGEGTLRYGGADEPVEVLIRGLDLDAVLDAAGIESTLRLALAGDDHIDGRLQLPGYRIAAAPWQQQALQFSLQGQLRELALARYLLKDQATFSGHIDMDMKGRGTLGKPLLAGDIRLQDGTLGINQMGIELRKLQIALSSKDDALSLHGSAKSGKGQLALDGDLLFTDIAHWKARVNLQGEDFEIVHIPEAVALISPDLHADIAPSELRLTGRLHVPSARFKPKQRAGGVAVSRDVVIIEPEREAEPKQPWKTYSQVQISLGDDVRLDGFGVKGHLTGKLDLKDAPEQVTTGRGKLGIEKGSYTVYGRELRIVKGNLLFSDGPVDNPGLDFDAERVVGDVHAGVRARGTLKEPELALYSDPALSDADIVSYITLGRPAAQAGQGGGSATDALAMATGNLLAGDISESLGLEELRLQSEGSLEEASLVLGTYLSPQLFVRYSAGLYEAASQFEAIYELNRNWSVQTRTSREESSADVVFSFER